MLNSGDVYGDPCLVKSANTRNCESNVSPPAWFIVLTITPVGVLVTSMLSHLLVPAFSSPAGVGCCLTAIYYMAPAFSVPFLKA
jgi:hypothetical protein